MTAKQIEDLDDDVFRVILSALTIYQCLTLAETNTTMRDRLQRIFMGKRKTKNVEIEIATDEEWIPPQIEIEPGCIKIYGRKFAFQFLRLFGPSIDRLSLYYSLNQQTNERINMYLYKYTRQSLKSIHCTGGTPLSKNRVYTQL